jgi:hypothetical protein
MEWLLLILAVGITAAITARLSGGGSKVGEEERRPALPAATKFTAVDIDPEAIDWTNPTDIMDAATKAQSAGMVESAKALASKAQETGDVKRALESLAEKPVPSPIPGVTDKQWSSFVGLFKGTTVDEVSPAYCLGIFNIGFRRLLELGLAYDVKQGTHEGKTVWMGKLKPPMTMKGFLNNPVLQYRVFAKDMRDRAALIQKEYAKVIGTELPGLEGIKVSLSGLLGVIKLAGTKGFHGWVTDPKQREKFAHTTTAFKTANGLF